tara:strand:+ start:156 stop:632 length:477 start_codon:yes stop_codon:yes gene_type:complete
MKHLFFIISFFILSSSYAQVDTSQAITGEWTLKAFKDVPAFIGWNEDIETKCILKSDSLLTIKITRDSIFIIRRRFQTLKDTFSYTYKIIPDTSRYSLNKHHFILYPDKKTLKGFKRSYRKRYKKFTFGINKFNNSQLVLETFAMDNYPVNPFLGLPL